MRHLLCLAALLGLAVQTFGASYITPPIGTGSGGSVTGSYGFISPLSLSGTNVSLPLELSNLKTNPPLSYATNFNLLLTAYSNVLTLSPTSTTARLNGMHLTNQAQRAAFGQTIDVLPGVYHSPTNVFSILRNGINWNFRPGAVLICGTTGDESDYNIPFNDWSGAVTSYIWGAGTFIVSNNLANFLNLTNSASRVIWHAKEIRAANEQAAIMQGHPNDPSPGGGKLWVYATDGIYADGYDAYINQHNPNSAQTFLYASRIVGDTTAGDSAFETTVGYANPGDCIIRAGYARGDLTLADNMDVDLGTLDLGANNVVYSPLAQQGNGVLRNTYVYGTSNRTTSLISTPSDSGLFATHGTFVQCVFVGSTNRPLALITNDNGVATTFISSKFLDGFGATNSIRSKNSQKVVLVGTDTPLGLHANISSSASTNHVENRFKKIATFEQGIDVSSDLNANGQLNAGDVTTTGEAILGGGLELANGVTASRALMVNSSGKVTNVVSSSPSTEYVKADGTTGTPTGAQTPVAQDINYAGYGATNMGRLVINGTASVASYIALTGTNDVPVVTQAAASNSIPVTNIVGLIHRAAAVYIEVDCNREQDIQITNRLAANTIVNWLNAVQGQVYQLRFTGAASGGSDYYITNTFPAGYLVVNQSTNAAPLAVQLPVLVADGTGGELNMRAYKHVSGTNLIGALISQYAE